jgi:tetratricopeptide (TPR) repeat protein
MEDAEARAKANQFNLQAGQRYVRINAHIKVYRSRNAETEQLARNGIEFIEAALKLFPNDPAYLNTYALLLADGLGQRELALEVFDRATQFDPDNIQIRQNIRDLQSWIDDSPTGTAWIEDSPTGTALAAGPAPRATQESFLPKTSAEKMFVIAFLIMVVIMIVVWAFTSLK